MKRVVSVIGPAKCSKRQAELAEQVGIAIAERDAVLVCGGRGGVMEAACRGAATAGGITVGILPGSDPGQGNRFLTIALPTGLGEARNVLIASAGDAVIAIGGAVGTLSEIAFALKAGRRVIGLETWTATAPNESTLEIVNASSAEEAVDLALLENAGG
ncbi:MAG: TIGR00725 family protein [Anaerolineales bacterium]